jgi:hypothetical protein
MALSPEWAYQCPVLIVELVMVWVGLSVVLGLPLGRVIRRADVREFPLRDSPWWAEVTDERTDHGLAVLRGRALSV